MKKKKLFMLGLMGVASAGALGLASCDTTANPLFEKVETKVSVLLNYGYDNLTENVEVTKNSIYTPKSLTREGYRFAGWYFDQAYTQAFVSGSAVSTSINLYAKWEVIEMVTIKYIVEGNDYASTTFEKGNPSVRIPNPEKTGYTFVGWYLGEELFDADKATTNVTVEARFAINTYNVNFDLAGGTADSIPTEAVYNTTITLPTPTKQGFTFKEFVDGDGNKYAAGATVTIVKETTFRAVFEALPEIKTVRITLNYTDGRENVVDEIVKNSAYQTSAPTRTGYQFAGWYLDEGYQSEFSSGTEVNSNITLYAKWNINKYEVVINANGGKILNEDNYIIQNVEYNTSLNTILNNIEPIKENYVAVGFSLEENGEALTAEELASTKVTSATTIYVVWAETVEVTLDFNGGSLDELDTKTIRVKKNSAVEGITPVKSGYTLAGWSLEADGEKLPADYVVEENVTLYAVWEIIPSENNITITLKKVDLLTNKAIAEDFTKVINKGEMVANVKIFYDDYYIASVADEEGNPIDFFTVYQKDTTVTIKYIKKNYTFKNQTEAFELKGGYAANEDGTIAVSKSLNDENNVKFSIPEGFKATINVAYKTAKAPAEEKSFSIKVLYNDDVTEGIAITSENTDPQTVEAIIYATNNTNDVYIGRQGNTSGIIESISVTLEALEPVRLTVVDGDATKTIQAYKDMAYANFLGEFNKKGYYVEYYSDESFTTLVPSAAVINADQTIYIKNTLIDYDVVFVDGTNQVSKTKMHYGDVVTKPDDLEKQGYRFIGWYDAEDENQTIVDFTNLKLEDKSVTYVAKWVEQFVVVFKDIKNETLDVKTVDSGSNVELPEAPEVEGYDFVGWVLKDTEFTGQNIKANLEVNAVYKIKTYNITLNLDGGDVEQALPTSVKHGTEITLPEVTKDGYEFLRYEIGNGIYNALDKITVTSDLEIVAKWEEKPGVEWVHVTLNYNVDNYANETKKVQKGSAFNTPEPLRGGYKFAGWYSDENLQTEFVSGSNIESDMTLYAKWKEIFSVTFMLDGSNYLDKEAVEGDKVEALDRDPERDEDVFEAWYADEACTTLFDFDKPITATTIIYGKWKFKVTFEGLEGTAFVSTNGTPAIPNGIPTKEGYKFVKWLDIDKPVTADTEIKAEWKVFYTKYSLTVEDKTTFAGNTDYFTVTGATADSSIKFGGKSDKVSFTIEASDTKPVIARIIVSGKSGSGSGNGSGVKLLKGETTIASSTEVLQADDTDDVKIDEYVTLTANATYDIMRVGNTFRASKIEVIVYQELATVTLMDGEDVLDSKYVISGDKLNVKNPTKTNYDFVGWYKDKDFNEEFDLDDAVDGNLTLYAKFEAKKFTLTIHGNGGNATSTSKDLVAEEIPYGSKVMELKASSEFNPSKEGYVMLSLALTADGLPLDEDALNALTVDGNLELFIVWTKTSTITFVDGNTTHTHTLAPAIQNTIEKWPDKVVEMAGAKEGYEFVGWFIDDNTEFTLQTEITDDLTVTAKWIELFKVTYYAGSDKFDEQTVKNGNTATKPTTTPTKENHDFKYWSLDITANDVVEYDFATTVTDNVDLYAYFELVKHDVTIDYAGGSLKDGQTEVASKVSYGSKITLPELVKAGFEFLYYQYGNEQLAAGAEITVLGDVEVTAVWEAKAEIKNVTYHYNYKSSEYGYTNKPLDKVVEIAKGEKYSTTETPTRDEYDFGGWYIDENLETPFVDESTIEDDVNLYAKWTIKKFSWTIYGNGGVLNRKNDETITISSNIEYGTAPKDITFTDPFEPKLRGYEFKGYSYTTDGELINMPEFMNAMITEDIEIYVIWELAEYSITYNLDGGTNSVNNPTEFTIKTDTITFEDATKEGYRFDGWYCDLDDSNSKVETIEKGSVVENVIIYAKWTENKYTIAFDANGGTGTMNSIENVEYSKEEGLTANAFTKTGYEFIGWATTANVDVAYADEATVSKLTAEDGATVTLYAVWKIVKELVYTGAIESYSSKATKYDQTEIIVSGGGATEDTEANTIDGIKFTKNLKTGGGTDKPDKANGNRYFQIDMTKLPIDSSKEYVRARIYFKGGSSRTLYIITDLADRATSDTSKYFYSILINDTYGHYVDLLLPTTNQSYYICCTNQFRLYGVEFDYREFNTVSFDLNGGTGSVDSQIVRKTDKVTQPLATSNPTKEHYEFAGWATRTGEENAYVYTPYDFDSLVNEDLVLYATWTPEKYTVTFDANGGEFAQNVETEQEVDYNNFIAAQVEPTRTGYTFAGWNSAADGSGTDYSTTAGSIEADITLYAKWDANDVKVTLNANGGKFGEEDSIEITAKFAGTVAGATGYAVPTSASGAFVKWTVSAAADSNEYDVSSVINSEDDIVLYAQYASSVTVTFYNGDAVYETLDDVEVGTKIAKPTADPTKEHYEFAGWATRTGEPDAYIYTLFDFATTEVSGELDLYATWTPVKYTVTFNPTDGTFAQNVETEQEVDYNNYIASQDEPTQDGYVFAGWYDEDGNEYTTEKGKITENITLKAKWYDKVINDTRENVTDNLSRVGTRPGDTANTYVSNGIITYKYNADLTKDVIMSNGENSGLGFNDASGSSRYIKVVLEKEGYIKFAYTNNTNNTGYIAIGTSAGAPTSETENVCTVAKSGTSKALVEYTSQKLSAGTYYINWSRKQLLFNYITILTGELSVEAVSSISGDVKVDSNSKLSVSNVKASILNSTDKLDLISSQYVVYVDDVIYNGASLANGEHKVTVKYGKYTTYETMVGVGLKLSSTTITYDSASSSFIGTDSDKLFITGNLSDHGDNSAQFSETNVIKFYVNALSRVIINGYNSEYGVFDIYVNGVKQDLTISSQGTYEFDVYNDSKVELKAKNVGTEESPAFKKSYIKGIQVIDYLTDKALGTTNISWNKDLATPAFDGTNVDKLEISGSLRNNGDGSAQFSANTSITFVARAESKITINAHSNQYGLFDIYINGELANLTVSNSKYVFTVNKDSKIVIATSDASKSYIKGIEVQEYLIDENTTISWNKDLATPAFDGTNTDKLEIEGTLSDHNDGSAQFSSNTIIRFEVKDGAKVTIYGHSASYGIFDIYVNDHKQNFEISATGEYVFAVESLSMIEIKTSDASKSYIKGIKVEYPISNATLSFATDGNYADAATLGFVMTAQNSANTTYGQVKNGSIKFRVAAHSKVTITGYYSVDYEINGTLVQGTTTDELTKEFIFDDVTEVTIVCQTGENSYSSGNYFTSIVIA